MRRPLALTAVLLTAVVSAAFAGQAAAPGAANATVAAATAHAATTTKKASRKARTTRCTTRTVRTAAGRRRTVRRCRTVTRRPARRPATTPSTPASAAPTPAAAPGGERAQIRDCANTERAKVGLGPLADDAALDRAAQAHAEDMRARDYFAHESPEGTMPWDRIEATLRGEAPFTWMGENIAMGFADVPATCVGWMNSPGHRANILNPHYDTIGTAWVDGYAVQEFGGRSG